MMALLVRGSSRHRPHNLASAAAGDWCSKRPLAATTESELAHVSTVATLADHPRTKHQPTTPEPQP